MTVDTAFILINCALTAILLALLMWRRVFRTLPLFVAYNAYTFLFALSCLTCSNNVNRYLLVWSTGIVIDTVFYLCVLIELGTAALRYNRVSPLPRGLVVLLFLGTGLSIWLLARWPAPPRLPMAWQLDFRALQASGILEVAAILTLAWWGGLQDLHWPERELRVVVGMGSWALVQLCVLMLHEHGLVGRGYHWLDLLTPASVTGVQIYWLHYFWVQPDVAAMSRPDHVEAGQTGTGQTDRSGKAYLVGQA